MRGGKAGKKRCAKHKQEKERISDAYRIVGYVIKLMINKVGKPK